jgi:hypothetical protein
MPRKSTGQQVEQAMVSSRPVLACIVPVMQRSAAVLFRVWPQVERVDVAGLRAQR